MERFTGMLLALCLAVPCAWGDDAKSAKPKESAENAEKVKAAKEYYQKMLDAYMHCKLDVLKEGRKGAARYTRFLSGQQRKDLGYMRSTAPTFRPKWWNKTHSSSKTMFRANIWGRPIVANYVPSRALGFQSVMIYRNRIVVTVSWKPSLVDNPNPAAGELAKIHKMTKGDIGEVVVWHELGHNYITSNLPVKSVWPLYEDHRVLFFHLQEFYADMTALYHASPYGRLATLMLRLDGLDWYREDEQHDRAAHAIGAIILADAMSDPGKWPSFHFPPEVPKDHVERRTIIYLYEHIAPTWSLDEDRRLRTMIGKLIRANGNEIFKKKGKVPLANGLTFRLMAADDREHQKKRDAWVTGKIKELVKSGRADKPDKKKSKWTRASRIEIPW